MNTQLLCLFTTKGQIDNSLDFILKKYILQNNNIFVLQSKINDDELYITFNVEKGSAPIDSEWKTILVHRKKQSNTIYTINALNEVIKSKTGGQIDTSFQINWDDFTNCILTTSNTGYRMISTKVFKTINTQNL